MPPTKARGTNTDESTSAIATTGPDTSFIAWSVASRGDRPSSIWCSTASTTTIASSTTNPMASTSPNNERVLIENPSKGKTAYVPINDTGTAMSGMSVARQFCKNRNTTKVTSATASRIVIEISLIPSTTGKLASRLTT